VLQGRISILPFVETRPMRLLEETLREHMEGRAGQRRIVMTPDFDEGPK
jgi:hypothetical protein